MANDARAAEIDLWRLRSGGAAGGALRSCLSADEIQRADAFRADRDRDRYIFFRAAVRRILGKYLSMAAGDVPLSSEPREKPRLAGRAGPWFNLSHSGDRGLLAVCRTAEVGVDLEELRPVERADDLAARFFSAAERAAYEALTPEQRTVGFLRCWTRKEAYLKATGAGLSFPLERFTVTLAPGEPARLVCVEGDPDAPGRWHIGDCDPDTGCVAAVAAEVPTVRIAWCTEPVVGVPSRVGRGRRNA